MVSFDVSRRLLPGLRVVTSGLEGLECCDRNAALSDGFAYIAHRQGRPSPPTIEVPAVTTAGDRGSVVSRAP